MNLATGKSYVPKASAECRDSPVVREIRDDSDLFPSPAFDPGCHVELYISPVQRQHVTQLGGFPDLAHRDHVDGTALIIAGYSLRSKQASFLDTASVTESPSGCGYHQSMSWTHLGRIPVEFNWADGAEVGGEHGPISFQNSDSPRAIVISTCKRKVSPYKDGTSIGSTPTRSREPWPHVDAAQT